MSNLRCNACKKTLRHVFVDLGQAPLVSSYLPPDADLSAEPFYPLRAYVCDACFLVQLPEAAPPEALFGEYPYFSSFSDSWLAHARAYVDQMTDRYHYDSESLVIEVASNDGYLLKYFQAMGVPVLGVEPAANVARAAVGAGVPTVNEFFGRATAEKIAADGRLADLIVGNNVLAHVPDINDFVSGMERLLKPDGVITMEFPHVYKLMQFNQFDTIFHEHFSYLSLLAVEAVFKRHGLRIFDVEEIPTHGGSLRIHASHEGPEGRKATSRVAAMRDTEKSFGLDQLDTYSRFSQQVQDTKEKLVTVLTDIKKSGSTIVGYGAPGKGCILLNYCGIGTDFLDYTVDRNPTKQGSLMPGVHVPICEPGRIRETRPDYVFVLPWNLKEEILEQQGYVREWGGKFIVPIPEVTVC